MENDLISVSAPGATHRLVLLHGWGADADDLIPFGKVLINGLTLRKIELVALRAPETHPDGCGRQWYGLFPPDWADVPAAINALTARLKFLCQQQIPLEKTVILGFSQGGAMALGCGCELSMAGVICCSAYPHPDWNPPKKTPPVLLLHGKHDEVVPCEASRRLLLSLRENKSDADIVLFEGGHEIPTELLPKIQLTLKKWIS